MACALRWGVTHVGNFHYWALLTLSREYYFRYRERSGRQHSLEAILRRKSTRGFDIDYVKTCIKFLILMYVCIKSNLLALEPCNIVGWDIFCEYWCRGPSGHYFTRMWTLCGHCKLLGQVLYLG